MCGICGYATRRDDRTSIEAMTAALAHRGPDDSGTRLISTQGRTVALGHRRLSIIDLSSAGHQPMQDARGEVLIVYNGEVYNFPEIRAELERRGRSFVSRTDTEVVLTAYLEWGEESLIKLDGMFAFAILDRRNDRLLLARDRLGIKPIYYSLEDGEIAFASELKALARYAGFRGAVDLDAVYEYLSFQYVPAPRSIYRDTFKLEPGCLLRFDLATGAVSQHRWWDPVTAPPPLDPSLLAGPEEHLVDELDRRLTAAVTRHLISDVPVGVFLSSGLDSTLVAAMAMKAGGGSLETFTIGFDDPRRDESTAARAIAKHLGTVHHEHRLEPRELFDVIPLLSQWHDEPMSNSSALPTFHVCRLARSRVKVALSGHGGDELMCGYSTYYRAAVIERLWKGCPRSLRPLIVRWSSRFPALTPEAVTPGVPAGDALAIFHYLMARFKGQDHERLIGRRYDFSRTRFYTAYRASSDPDVRARLMLVDLVAYLADAMFPKLDRASMFHGLEVRVPLLDNDWIDFVRAIPSSRKTRRGRRKRLFEAMLERYLPRALFDIPKRGFGAPLDQWLRHELRPLVDTYLDPARIKKRGLLNPEFVTTVVDRHLSGRWRYQHMLWNLIVLEMWFERWIDRGSVVSFADATSAARPAR